MYVDCLGLMSTMLSSDCQHFLERFVCSDLCEFVHFNVKCVKLYISACCNDYCTHLAHCQVTKQLFVWQTLRGSALMFNGVFCVRLCAVIVPQYTLVVLLRRLTTSCLAAIYLCSRVNDLVTHKHMHTKCVLLHNMFTVSIISYLSLTY